MKPALGFQLRVAAATLLLCGAPIALAQTPYPSKPVRIVTADAGGSSDFFVRVLAQELSKALGQQFIVDNHGGAGSAPGENAARAAPDGYSLLFYTMNLWITPLLQKANYDPIADFAPITLATKACSVLVVTPSLPVKSVKDLITLAKAKPGDLVYAHGSAGSASHLAGAMFRSMTGVQMLNVPYKGSAQALIDVMAGQAQLMFPNSAVVPPHLKSGKLKALAVTSAERSPLFPDLPAVSETVPGFAATTMNGFWAPARTPEAIVRRLNQEAVRIIRTPEMKSRLATNGIEPVGSSPQEFAATIAEDMTRWAAVIKAAHIRADD